MIFEFKMTKFHAMQPVFPKIPEHALPVNLQPIALRQAHLDAHMQNLTSKACQAFKITQKSDRSLATKIN